MTRWCSTCVLILLASAPTAGQTQNDFAFGFTVEPESERPLWELQLPDDVYRTVTRPDLGDLRVFNAEGAIVPHAVRRASPLQVQPPAPRSLPFFPLRGQAADGTADRTLRIITDAKGAIINATSEGPAPGESSRVTAYLIDVGSSAERPNRLTLEWDDGAGAGFAATIDVESSDDLSAWGTVVRDVTLADLREGDATLVHRDITLPALDGRYLRLGWPASLRDVRLTGVQAFFPAGTQPPARETILVAATPASEDGTAFEFDTHGVRPVDRVGVVFQERNAVVTAVLLSRDAPDRDWRRRHRSTFYSLERDGTRVQSEPASLTPTSDRYWRMEIEGGQKWTGRLPSLEIGWIPGLLTVVAQGQGPFTVAFGSAIVQAQDRAADGLLDVIDNERRGDTISAARASETFTLGGQSRLEPAPAPWPWRTWVLWGVLLVGVAILGWMVRQLVGQLRPS